MNFRYRLLYESTRSLMNLRFIATLFPEYKLKSFTWTILYLIAASSVVVWVERLTIGEFMFHTLERRFPEWQNNSSQPVAGIIALGGSFNGRKSPGERVQVAVQLARRFPNAKIIF